MISKDVRFQSNNLYQIYQQALKQFNMTAGEIIKVTTKYRLTETIG